MNPQEYRRAKDIFREASERTPRERSSFIEQVYADDPGLRREVEALFARSDEQTRDIRTLTQTTPVPDRVATDPPPSAGLLKTIGSYHIVRRIGEGGMGIVFEAEQKNPLRTVALKIVKIGLTSDNLIRRFEYQAHVLGQLEHPGIARIYEAGTAKVNGQSQPYFAMEYIQGLSLTRYAESNHLDTGTRLELMARVCHAVQHAHQKGVLHHDLKPGNILVVEEGTEARKHEDTKG